MPKRKISDLGPNECIHCPTEESRKALGIKEIEVGGINVFHKDTIWFPSNDNFADKANAYIHGYTIYPRTNFVDKGKESETTPVKIGFDQDSPEGDSPMYIIAGGPFKTGDVVYGRNESREERTHWFDKGMFIGYTTDGKFIIQNLQSAEYIVYSYCRFPLQKQQHTISCTDEVLEKVKQIDGVDFIS